MNHMWGVAFILNAAQVAFTWGYLNLVYGGASVTCDGHGCSGTWE